MDKDDIMSIHEEKCFICGEDLSTENYHYISAGRLQQGVNSDPKSYLEYTLCTNCYAQVKAEIIVSVQKKKTAKQQEQ